MPKGIYQHKKGIGGKRKKSGVYPHKLNQGFQKGHKINLGRKFGNVRNYSGKNNPMYGKSGELSPVWKGGISFEPYSVDWTKTLKKSIRERDKYTCQICEKEPSVDCHHINYDKKDCNSNNLITLCRKCHIKTNFNRNYWINYFKNKQYE